MEVHTAIFKRRSIRKFKSKSIPTFILKNLINAARLAPSAANLQPLEYVVVNRKDLLPKVFLTLKWAGYIRPKGNPPNGRRPQAYIVVIINTKKSKDVGIREIGAAIENIMLYALEKDLSSCWLISINKIKLRKILNLPSYCKIDSVVALGYPDEKPVIEKFRGTIKYWKDEKGILHVPKRDLKDIFHNNTYREL